MTCHLTEILGWSELDMFPTDRREESLITKQRDGSYAMFQPVRVSSFGMDSHTNNALLRQSDRILRTIQNINSSEMPKNRISSLLDADSAGVVRAEEISMS